MSVLVISADHESRKLQYEQHDEGIDRSGWGVDQKTSSEEQYDRDGYLMRWFVQVCQRRDDRCHSADCSSKGDGDDAVGRIQSSDRTRQRCRDDSVPEHVAACV